MGLDMYLEATKTLYKPIGEEKTDKRRLAIFRMFPDMFENGNLDYVRVTFEAGYWRKANAIHKWFVDKCQDGNDDCRHAYVPNEKLVELRDLCKEVLSQSKIVVEKVRNGYTMKKDEKTGELEKVFHVEKGRVIKNPDVAEKLLPTQSGFFFGSYEYDEWYLCDLEETIKIIDRCLKLDSTWSFYYHSSW